MCGRCAHLTNVALNAPELRSVLLIRRNRSNHPFTISLQQISNDKPLSAIISYVSLHLKELRRMIAAFFIFLSSYKH